MSKENINKFVNSLDKGDAKQAGEDLKNVKKNNYQKKIVRVSFN